MGKRNNGRNKFLNQVHRLQVHSDAGQSIERIRDAGVQEEKQRNHGHHELSPAAIIIGILISVLFGAANAYLGLKVGLTISASIPAAVMSLGIMRGILRRSSLLESNMVQTIGSAGESVAAGVIFTVPALFLWAAEGRMEMPGILEITLIALIGGILGIFFMVPLRKALIVKEHDTLPYPEGTACAQVLLSAEKEGSHSGKLFFGVGIGALIKFLLDGLKLLPGEVMWRIRGYAGAFGTQVYPAVMSVGYICGPKISAYMLAGGILSWLVLIPLIVFFGQDVVLFPATVSVMEIYRDAGAAGIWNTYIRYIGAGALAAAGILSLLRSIPLIIGAFRDAVKSIGSQKQGMSVENGAEGRLERGAEQQDKMRREQELPLLFICVGILVMLLLVWLAPAIPVNFLGALIVVVFGFFFATVSSRLVGLVGSSNNPASGMVIATLLVATVLLKLTGQHGMDGMHAAMAIASVICVVVCAAGDTSQDLKTGYILGATPRKQQIGELIGVTVSAITIGLILHLLNRAWAFGSDEISAPQASLMKLITEGVMENNIPWTLVFIGAFLTVVVNLLGIPALSFAIGIYLPVALSACVMVGGVVRLVFERSKREEKEKQELINDGTLVCSGMIAGEGLLGIVIAFLAVIGVSERLVLPDVFGNLPIIKDAMSLLLLIASVFALITISFFVRKNDYKRKKG